MSWRKLQGPSSALEVRASSTTLESTMTSSFQGSMSWATGPPSAPVLPPSGVAAPHERRPVLADAQRDPAPAQRRHEGERQSERMGAQQPDGVHLVQEAPEAAH